MYVLSNTVRRFRGKAGAAIDAPAPLCYNSGMNRTELLTKLCRTPAERVLLSRVWDQMEAARTRGQAQHTHFLSPDEQGAVRRLAEAAGEPEFHFCGGYDQAQRQIAVFLPDWLAWEDYDPSEDLAALRTVWSAHDHLTHRDLLGALMGQGIKREVLGDLLVGPESCDLLVLREMAPYLLQSFQSAGRAKLRVEEVPLAHLHIPVQEVRRIRDTVSSLRLDAVAAVGFSLSRSKMADLVRAGRVTVNWQATERTDQAVQEGDVISCRGLGRCRVAEIGGLSRKGRINLTMERYL